jgi:hypothetical protein
MYICNHNCILDPTLTVENLIGVMEKVTSDEGRRREVWEEVLEWNSGFRVFTPSSYLDDVYSKSTTAEEKTHALADVYFNSRPDSSWQHLVRTLYAQSELSAAEEAKAFLQQLKGGLLYLFWTSLDNCCIIKYESRICVHQRSSIISSHVAFPPAIFLKF